MTQSRTNSITWLREHWLELLLAFALLVMLTVSPSSVRAKEADLPTGGNPAYKSNLLVKHEFVIENQMGSIPVTSHVGDYRKVDGVR